MQYPNKHGDDDVSDDDGDSPIPQCRLVRACSASLMSGGECEQSNASGTHGDEHVEAGSAAGVSLVESCYSNDESRGRVPQQSLPTTGKLDICQDGRIACASATGSVVAVAATSLPSSRRSASSFFRVGAASRKCGPEDVAPLARDSFIQSHYLRDGEVGQPGSRESVIPRGSLPPVSRGEDGAVDPCQSFPSGGGADDQAANAHKHRLRTVGVVKRNGGKALALFGVYNSDPDLESTAYQIELYKIKSGRPGISMSA